MTEKDLSIIIKDLNLNHANNLIQKKSLSKKVELAKIWGKKPEETDEISNSSFDVFFLIKNDDNKYVAIVFDMYRDLHWFVDENHRKNGHLTMALQEVIIPYLVSIRGEQRITINEEKIGSQNYLNSKKVAENLGFIKQNNIEYIVENNGEYLEKYQQILDFSNIYNISEERMLEIRKKIKFAYEYLNQIQVEIDFKLGDPDYSEEFKELIDPLKYECDNFMDLWYEKNACR